MGQAKAVCYFTIFMAMIISTTAQTSPNCTTCSAPTPDDTAIGLGLGGATTPTTTNSTSPFGLCWNVDIAVTSLRTAAKAVDITAKALDADAADFDAAAADASDADAAAALRAAAAADRAAAADLRTTARVYYAAAAAARAACNANSCCHSCCDANNVDLTSIFDPNQTTTVSSTVVKAVAKPLGCSVKYSLGSSDV